MNEICCTQVPVDHKSSMKEPLCSIVAYAGGDYAKINDYVSFLHASRISDNYEVFIVTDNDPDIGTKPYFKEAGINIVVGDGRKAPEQLRSITAQSAKGRYLLLVNGLLEFDGATLEESIRELECSGDKFSVSANRNFLLVQSSYYSLQPAIARYFEEGKAAQNSRSAGDKTFFNVRDLSGRSNPIRCGQGTFIDPDVVIDSPESVSIGANCVIRKGVVLRPEGGRIIIGDNCVINHYSVFHAKGGIYIGDWAIIAPNCGIYAQNHSFDSFELPITKQPNTGKGVYLMGDNWLGAGAIICDDVTLGKGAVAGANATVTKSVPMACVAAGSPARIIRKRHRGEWDFHKCERVDLQQVSERIAAHVKGRGELIKTLVESTDVVLDVGCGEGDMLADIAGLCERAVGCDYSIEAVEIASGRYGNVDFVCCNSTNLRFAEGSFTKVILSDVAEHLLPVQFTNTLREIHRILKKDGRLILATPITGKGKATSTYAHIYEYSKCEIVSILNKLFCDVRLIDEKFGIFAAQRKNG